MWVSGSRRNGRIAALSLVLSLSVATGVAAAQEGGLGYEDFNIRKGPYWNWIDPFPEPMFLIECRMDACPDSGLRLVPVDGLSSVPYQYRTLGGPYEKRFEVELARNRLVGAGLPEYSVLVPMTDARGETIGGFWLGAKPACAVREAPLTGDVDADFGAFGFGDTEDEEDLSRPDHFPVPFELGDYTAEMERLQAQGCGEQKPQ